VITCKDCLRALQPFLDRELSEDDLVEVKFHLAACGSCEEIVQFEESLRKLVMGRCQEQAAPANLRERITLSLSIERKRRGPNPS
jgi:mycothiol system anti-sigma-R factor